jgi:phosphotriesterase-related protein
MSSPVVRTVLGDVPASQLGVTLSHEHVFIDCRTWLTAAGSVPPGVNRNEKHPRIEDLWWFRQWPNSSETNLLLDDYDLAVSEIGMFRDCGGKALVDVTPTRALGRDPRALRDVALATGLHIVCGTGLYVHPTHPVAAQAASAQDLAAQMADEITGGIEDTGIRAGVIGEIGTSWPIHPAERKILDAASLAQRQTGAAITIHTACDFPQARPALAVADFLAATGADLSRVIMGHLDTSVDAPGYAEETAALGCYIEFDLFGNETFHSE